MARWLLALMLLGGLTYQQRSIWDGVYTAAQAERGEAAVLRRCTYCHGGDLKGADDPPGPPLRGEIFLAKWRGRPLGELFDTIADTMPRNNPGSLSAETCADVVAFLLDANGLPRGPQELSSDPEVLSRIVMTETRRP
jgi:hypothetical protein